MSLFTPFYLTLNGKHLTEEALYAMDRSSPIPLVMHGRLRGGFFFGARRLGAQSLPHQWGAGRPKSRCFRCGALRNSAPQDIGSSLPRRESHHPDRGAEAQTCPSESYVSGAACYSSEERWNSSCYLSLSRDDCFTIGPDGNCDTASKVWGLQRICCLKSGLLFRLLLLILRRKSSGCCSCVGQIDSAKKHVERLDRSVTHHRSQLQTCLENRDKKLAEVSQLETEYRLLTDFKLSRMQLQLPLHTCLLLILNVSLRERTPWIWKWTPPVSSSPPVSSEESCCSHWCTGFAGFQATTS